MACEHFTSSDIMWWSKGSRRRGRSQRRLSFEQFEPRWLMAVTTSLANGTLTITGDANADDIAIVGTAKPGEITVTGRNGTVVDGVANGSTTIAGVRANLLVNLGDGNNVVNLDNLYLAGRLEVRTGAGNDRITLGATGVVSTAQYCILHSGDGSDVVRAEDYKVFIREFLWVFLQGNALDGARDSASLVGASALTSVEVFGGPGARNDIVLRGVTSGGNLNVSGLAPVNNIAVITSAASGALLIGAQDGRNSIYIDTCYAARFVQVISVTYSGVITPPPPAAPPHNIDATVTVARCQTPQIIVRTGGGSTRSYLGGNDSVTLYGNNVVGPPIQVTQPAHAAAHVIYVETGDGNDVLNASYNVARGDVFISMSDNDDMLSLVGNLATGFVSVDGGLGINRLQRVANQFGGFAVSRFQ